MKIRQEINILDAVFSTPASTAASSNDMVYINTDNFQGPNSTLPGVTYYFEFEAYSSATGSPTISLQYFGTDYVTVTPSLTTTPTLYRSAAFDPSSSPYLNVHITADAGGTTYVKSARIIVLQDSQNSDPPLYTQTQIEIGANQAFTATSPTALSQPKYWKYVAADWNAPGDSTGAGGNDPAFFFSVCWSISSTKGTGTARLQVADGTGDGFTGWSNVGTALTTTSTTPYVYLEDVNGFTPIDGRNYRVAFSTSNSKYTLNVYNAKIYITQKKTVHRYWNFNTGTHYTYYSYAFQYPAVRYLHAVASLSSTRIAVGTGVAYTGRESLQTYDISGSTWTPVGNAFTLTGISTSIGYTICALSSSSIAYSDDTGTLKKYNFDGTNWSLDGSALSLSGTLYNATIGALTSTRVVRCTYNGLPPHYQNIQAYDWNGSSWSAVGNQYTWTLAGYPIQTVAILSSTRIVAFAGGYLQAFDFDGTNWSTVGNQSTGPAYTASIAALSSTKIVAWVMAGYQGGGNGYAQTYSFDGTDWTTYGDPAVCPDTDSGNNGGPLFLGVSFLSLSGNTYRAAFLWADFDVGLKMAYAEFVDQDDDIINKLATQYLLAPNILGTGTGLQTYLTKWDSSEWSGGTLSLKAITDAANGSTSVTEIDTAAGAQISGSVVSSPDNQGFSSGILTYPATGNLDCKATTNNNDVYAVRLAAILTPALAISVNDTAATTESVSEVVGGINLFDTSTVAEDIALTIYPKLVSVLDNVTVTENVQPGIDKWFISVNDAPSTTENFELTVYPKKISVFDATGAALENIGFTLITSGTIDVTDPFSITEDVAVATVALKISVFDATAAVTESINVSTVAEARLVFDSSTVTENVTLALSTSTISVNDAVSPTENISVATFSYVLTLSVFDTSTSSEALVGLFAVMLGNGTFGQGIFANPDLPVIIFGADQYETAWLSARDMAAPGSGKWSDPYKIADNSTVGPDHMFLTNNYGPSTGQLFSSLSENFGIISEGSDIDFNEGVYWIGNGPTPVLITTDHTLDAGAWSSRWESVGAWWYKNTYWFVADGGNTYSYPAVAYLEVWKGSGTSWQILRSSALPYTPPWAGFPYNIVQFARSGSKIDFIVQTYNPPDTTNYVFALYTFDMDTETWSISPSFIQDGTGTELAQSEPFRFPNGDVGVLISNNTGAPYSYRLYSNGAWGASISITTLGSVALIVDSVGEMVHILHEFGGGPPETAYYSRLHHDGTLDYELATLPLTGNWSPFRFTGCVVDDLVFWPIGENNGADYPGGPNVNPYTRVWVLRRGETTWHVESIPQYPGQPRWGPYWGHMPGFLRSLITIGYISSKGKWVQS